MKRAERIERRALAWDQALLPYVKKLPDYATFTGARRPTAAPGKPMSPAQMHQAMLQWRFAMADPARATATRGPRKKPKPREDGSHGQ